MSYTIDYSEFVGQAKRDKALQDCQDYLGTVRYDHVLSWLREATKDCGPLGLKMGLEVFVGISGYPATVLVDLVFDELWDYAHQFHTIWWEIDLDDYENSVGYQNEMFNLHGAVPLDVFDSIFNDVLEFLGYYDY